MRFPKLSVPSAADVVERRIGDLIIAGLIRPGTRLPAERDIAMQTGVSRTTVREGLSRLMGYGLLRRDSNAYVVNDLVGLLLSTTGHSLEPSRSDHAAQLWQRIVHFAIEAARTKSTAEDRALTARAFAALQCGSGPTEQTRYELWMHVCECAYNFLALHCLHVLLTGLSNGLANPSPNRHNEAPTFDSPESPGWEALHALADATFHASSTRWQDGGISFVLEVGTPASPDAAFERLATDIGAGVFEINSRLPSVDELAIRYGLSENAIRLALHRCESRQLVQRIKQDEAIVVATHPANQLGALVALVRTQPLAIDAVFEFRAMLEDWSAQLATQHMTPSQHDQLDELLRKLDACTDDADGQFGRLDIQFHGAIGAATGNTAIASLQHALGELFTHVTSDWLVTHQQFDEGNREIQRQHRRVQKHMVSGDAVAAGKAMSSHLEYVRSWIHEHERKGVWSATARTRAEMRATDH